MRFACHLARISVGADLYSPPLCAAGACAGNRPEKYDHPDECPPHFFPPLRISFTANLPPLGFGDDEINLTAAAAGADAWTSASKTASTRCLMHEVTPQPTWRGQLSRQPNCAS